MAILQDNAGGKSQWHLFDLTDQVEIPPKGTFAATIIDICDRFEVERPQFENPAVMEKVDLTAFLFGFRDRNGTPHKIDSRPMKISGNEKSNLYGFLKSILGESPRMGWDYLELKGAKCLVTIEHAVSKAGTPYAAIAVVSPLPEGPGAPVQAPAPAMPPPAARPPVRTAAPTAAPKPAPAPVAVADNSLPF